MEQHANVEKTVSIGRSLDIIVCTLDFVHEIVVEDREAVSAAEVAAQGEVAHTNSGMQSGMHTATRPRPTVLEERDAIALLGPGFEASVEL